MDFKQVILLTLIEGCLEGQVMGGLGPRKYFLRGSSGSKYFNSDDVDFSLSRFFCDAMESTTVGTREETSREVFTATLRGTRHTIPA